MVGITKLNQYRENSKFCIISSIIKELKNHFLKILRSCSTIIVMDSLPLYQIIFFNTTFDHKYLIKDFNIYMYSNSCLLNLWSLSISKFLIEVCLHHYYLFCFGAPRPPFPLNSESLYQLIHHIFIN